jgi:hypothetical protein
MHGLRVAAPPPGHERRYTGALTNTVNREGKRVLSLTRCNRCSFTRATAPPQPTAAAETPRRSGSAAQAAGLVTVALRARNVIRVARWPRLAGARVTANPAAASLSVISASL